MNATAFTCDCSGTSFHGNICQRGIVTIDPTPQLTLNKKSSEISLTVNTDAQFVVLLRTSVHWKLLLEPDYLEFTDTIKKRSFTITPRVPGEYKIWYRIGVPWDYWYYHLGTVQIV